MPDIELSWASWEEFAPEGLVLLREEWEEYEPLLKPWKPFGPDVEAFERASRDESLMIATARVNGALAAYLFWTITTDPESVGHIVIHQGLWFASKIYTREMLGLKLFEFSLEYFARRIGSPTELDLHSMEDGRGAKLGSFFYSLGARPLRTHWSLKLEPKGT